MNGARVLVVGRADSTLDTGANHLEVVHEPRPRAALERLGEGFDCVVCVDLPTETVEGLASVAGCPVVERVPSADRTLNERVGALVKARQPDEWRRGRGPGDVPSAAMLRRAVDAAPVGVTIADATLEDCPLVYVNEGFERVTGYGSAEVLGRNCRFMQGAETRPGAAATFREAIERAEPRVVELLNYRKDGSEFWNRVELAPVEDESGTVTHFVGFQLDVTDRREAEAAVERERADLETLLNRVNGLLADVTAGLVEASSRSTVEEALVDGIAGNGAYPGAWVATPDLGTGRFDHGASTGVERVPAVPLDADDPVSRAFETGELVFAEGASAHEAVHDGSVVAVPLTYRETTYGVCCVYTTGAFGEHDRAVFRVLGRAAATAIHAVEGRRLLGSDAVTELELRLPEAFPAGLAARLDATLTYEGAVFGDERVRTFYTVAGVDAARVATEAAREPDVLGCRAVTDGSTPLFEVVVDHDSLVPTVADRGAELRTAVADADGLVLTLSVPVGTETRTLVEWLRGRFGPVELTATRERERPTRTRTEFRDELESRLTARQLTALRLAHVGGYFAPNRRASGDELAEAMGVSRSTFHQHLRAAHRKLVDGFFDPDGT